MSLRTARNRTWEVNGLRIEGLCWGAENLPPLLALHGWLDNAASFEMLAPHLDTHYVVALDLTGHGQSSRRSIDATYHIWDDLPELVAVTDQMGWQEFDLLGHSRGAIISTILASAIPDRILHLVLLDAATPEPQPEENFSKQLGQFLRDKPRLLKKEARIYASMDEAVSARTRNGLSARAAKILAKRGLIKHEEGGYVWSSDPRLYGASAVKLTKGQNRAILQNLTMPTLMLQAETGLARKYSGLLESEQNSSGIHIETMPGGHHFHMEEDAANVADRITRFLGTSRT